MYKAHELYVPTIYIIYCNIILYYTLIIVVETNSND